MNSRRASALVIVLSMLVLLVIVAIAFLTSVATETNAGRARDNAATASQLADSVTNLVMATITEATQAKNGSDRVAWASQPGMIRTWQDDGTLDRVFRLYSAPKMIDTTFNSATESSALAAWKTNAPADSAYNALWCDLNSPMPASDPALATRLIYPVVTPPGTLDAANGIPVDNPATSAIEGVQGFSIDSSPGFSPAGAITAANNPAPMPVRWMYVLKDGQIVSPTGGDTNASVFDSSVPVSATNPIVGRVAFWTDDETAKININTAAGGEYWATPRTAGTPAIAQAKFQPGRNEFQRYPGHPATTSLRAALGDKLTSSDEITAVAPRVQRGGSLDGTRYPANPTNLSDPSYLIKMANDTDRLYASVDELSFKPDRTANTPLSPATVQGRQFFLTANSKAPEVTLFDTPRVSIWPITQPVAKQDPFDKLLMFCGSLNSGSSLLPYYFQREKPLSTTHDWTSFERNRQLYAYLQRMTETEIPGFGGNFSTKFGTDRNQILTFIFDYIRSGANLFGAGHGAVAAEAGTPNSNFWLNSYAAPTGLDYKSTMVAPIQITPVTGTPTRGMGNTYATFTHIGLGFFTEGVTYNKTTNEVSFAMRAAPMVQTYWPMMSYSPMNPGPGNTDSNNLSATGLWVDIESIKGTVTFGGEPPKPLDFPVNDPVVYNRGNHAVSPLAPPGQLFLTNRNTDGAPKNTASGARFASSQFVIKFVRPATATYTPDDFDDAGSPKVPDTGPGPANMTHLDRITRDPTNPNFKLEGVEITLRLLAGPPDARQLVQSATVTFPDATYKFPVPDTRFVNLPASGTPTVDAVAFLGPGAQTNYANFVSDFRKRFVNTSGYLQANAQARSFGMVGEVLIGKELVGDYRLGVAKRNLADSDFRLPTPISPSSPNAHAFVSFSGSWMRSPAKGLVVQGINTTLANSGLLTRTATDVPATPSDMDGARITTTPPGTIANPLGDWDNGFSIAMDGPYFNAPDQGALGRVVSGSDFNPYYKEFEGAVHAPIFSGVYSPNRQMYSAFQFGSISSRALAGSHWETLLFCPNPAATRANHRGYTASPKDYLLADLFYMPIVDPFPVSDRLSTSGKINLNYSMQPFTNMTRATGLWAALQDLKLTAITETKNSSVADNNSGLYKYYVPSTESTHSVNYHLPLDILETLKGFEGVFSSNAIFKSATEIAEVFLVPQGRTYSNVAAFWADKRTTGDNTREQPYATLYPRLTTKSNTFTVHMRVQGLKKRTNSDQSRWEEGKDTVVSEYRGSALIERYIDPEEKFPESPDSSTGPYVDFATDASANLAPYYKWRVVQKRQFAP